MTPPARQEPDVADELGRLREMLENHFVGDEQSLRGLHDEIRGMRAGLVELDTRFQVHCEKYQGDQRNWEQRFGQGGDLGAGKIELGGWRYLLTGAALAGGGIFEGLRWLFEMAGAKKP